MTFDSVYQMFDPLTTVRKQHFWDWFSGDDLKAWWTESTVATPTTGMSDSVDGGYEITCDSASDEAYIHFNDKRQYSHTGSVFIGVLQISTGSDITSDIGFCNNKDDPAVASNDGVVFEQGSSTTYLSVSNGTRTLNNLSRTPDTNPHVFKIELTASNVTGYIDGVSEGTFTVNLPVDKLQPEVRAKYATSTSTTNIRYIEAYNT